MSLLQRVRLALRPRPRRCAVCRGRYFARNLCRRHYYAAYHEQRRRATDWDRARVIHRGDPGVWVREPDPALLNSLLTWDGLVLQTDQTEAT